MGTELDKLVIGNCYLDKNKQDIIKKRLLKRIRIRLIGYFLDW